MIQENVLSTPPKRKSSGSYRADIDGLRAIAVLSVLFFHARIQGFRGGFTGVDIFFVISGFLIGGHTFAEEVSGKFTFAAFYKRRAKRILPALFTVLITVLILGSLLLSPYELRRLATQSIAALLSVANLYYLFHGGYFAVPLDSVPLLMTWSLGVEEQFYIFMPLVMVWVLRFRKPLVLTFAVLTILSFGTACYQVAYARDAAFYLLPSRSWELFAGVILSLSAQHLRRVPRGLLELAGTLGSLLILLPIVLLSSTAAFPGLWALPSVLGATLLLFAEKSWVNTVVLSSKPLRYIGRISYSLYLWHWPLLSLTAIVLGTWPSRSMALMILLIAFILSMLSYRWIEQPFRRSSTPATPLLLRYAAASLVLIGLSVGIRQSYGLRFRDPALAAVDQRDGYKRDPCMITDSSSKPNPSSTCFENTGKEVVALWGDSHASSLAPEMRLDAHRSGYDFVEMSKTTCPPLEDTGRYWPASPKFGDECIAFNDNALHWLLINPRVKIVVLTANWKWSLTEPYKARAGWIVTSGSNETLIPSRAATAEIFSASLNRTIQALQAAGKEVFVLQDVPSFAVEPAWRWRTARQPLREWLFKRLDPKGVIDPGAVPPTDLKEDQEVRHLIAASGASTGASVFDLEAALCSSGRCRYRDQTDLFYIDNQHVSNAGAHAALSKWVFPSYTSSDVR